MEQGTISECLKAEMEENKQPYNRYYLKEEWLTYHLYINTRLVEGVPGMEDLSTEVRQLILQYQDICCSKLPKGRTMKVEPLDIKINPDMENHQNV